MYGQAEGISGVVDTVNKTPLNLMPPPLFKSSLSSDWLPLTWLPHTKPILFGHVKNVTDLDHH